MAKYKRVLIKLSGEALGENGRLFDFAQIERVAKVIADLNAAGAEIALVIGAGNIWRGRQGSAAEMTAVNADHMGMLGTMINSIAMQDAIERLGVQTRIMTAVEILNANTLYTDEELRKLLSGHLCRCTCYENILRAVKKTMYQRLGKPIDF